jgi:hypothetical protein
MVAHDDTERGKSGALISSALFVLGELPAGA